mmetsp:Transcript_13065/g.24031  ORF Transcript_13065/g.24031 Transcript_13065/m.24031 type:complete len:198 (-) Transcript_13065:77-670(-)
MAGADEPSAGEDIRLEFSSPVQEETDANQVRLENEILKRELRRSQRELEDQDVDSVWLHEIQQWRAAVESLRGKLEEEQARRQEALREVAEKRDAELVSEADACKLMELRSQELRRRQAGRRGDLQQVVSRTARLKDHLADQGNNSANAGSFAAVCKQQHVVGSGISHLFVACLPLLDVSTIEVARDALQAHWRKLG